MLSEEMEHDEHDKSYYFHTNVYSPVQTLYYAPIYVGCIWVQSIA